MIRYLLPLTLVGGALAASCSDVKSCSAEAGKNADPCCTPSPAGLFIFRQRFEPDVGGDMGSWGIDGMEVLDCTTQEQLKSETYGPTYTHEEIGSYCHRSGLMGGEEGIERAEGEWAQSEVGEGVEEVWERAARSSSLKSTGRYISTLAPSCGTGSSGEQVPMFFDTLHQLQTKFPIAAILADFDIIPSADVTYVLSELVEALSFEGHRPIVSCDNTTLFSISWPLHSIGPFQSSNFIPATLSRTSNCPKDGIVYLPSTSTRGQPTTTSYTWDEVYRPTPRPITMSHDDERLAYRQDGSPEPERLQFFKGSDEGREGVKEGKVEKQYWRDEL